MSGDPRDGEAPRAPGRIITFYSYKGGTGRSMALANVAWILAASGRRVLVVDWDFEAPGLHRYFRPFLPDPELSDTPGLIDLFVHFAEAARIQARGGGAEPQEEDRPWYYDRADTLRYSVPLEHEFGGEGVLDFVGAGRQGPSYGARVCSFHWGEFYEKLGGGVFLEAMKAQMREQYDYVLIDSRTGLSDTSGICTVQMPDELVVCFTLNRQSIQGAAATAESADAQRRLPEGQQGLRIWPVPMRVELAEKERLEAAQRSARERFAPLLWHVPAPLRPDYWGGIQVLYFPYYAYEEVLATIADPPRQTASLLSSMEQLASRLTDGAVEGMPRYEPGVREQLLARYQATSGRFFLSYANADQSTALVGRLADAIDRRFGANAAFWSDRIPLGTNFLEALESALATAEVLLVVIGPQWEASRGSRREVELSLGRRRWVVPVLVGDATVPDLLGHLHAARLREECLEDDMARLMDQLARLTTVTSSAPASTVDVDDPHRGQFGGESERGRRRLRATVAEASAGWFQIDLRVESTGSLPLEGEVEFHLHPTFIPSVVRVPVQDGAATLRRVGWGAFTVGAVADDGFTRLELNLAELSEAPAPFRSR